jgi:hypothetical protein
MRIICSNVFGSTKWYSRPSTSFGRGRRVVWETEKRRSGNSLRSLPQSVVFPAPDGDDTMRRRKSSLSASVDMLSCHSMFWTCSRRRSSSTFIATT